MPAPDPSSVLKTLREAVDFTRKVGAKEEAAVLEEFHKRFQTEKPTLKLLRGIVQDAMNQACLKIESVLLDECRDPRPGMELLVEEHERIWVAYPDLTYPKPPETDISEFAGSKHVQEKMVRYHGDLAGVRPIVERSIDFVRRYSRIIGSGDFKAAYALTDSGLRAWMSYKRFVGDHERAARLYRGSALEFHIYRVNYVLADDAARKKSNTSVEGWPKGTAKETRRGAIGGFWIRDRAAQTGCDGTLWIAEENNDYRIAKFNF